MENTFINKPLSIRKDQQAIIDRHNLNFSKFIQSKLDELDNNFQTQQNKEDSDVET